MKKIIFSIFLLFSAMGSILAQDAIIKRTGEEIKAKVRAVTDKEIEYVRFDNLDGPLYRIAKADVLLIMYANGTKDIFSNETTTPNNNNTATNNNNDKKGRTVASTPELPAQHH